MTFGYTESEVLLVCEDFVAIETLRSVGENLELGCSKTWSMQLGISR